ncbi:MAG: beta-ketoacyl-[acyl-carrier-protein] synthase family protein [Candidatus Magnetomorum sp.]|nr:beta-ketoacyl-[acyl-carrier-protein] synthase family protein [Candidatus Magnetomorum sp.]
MTTRRVAITGTGSITPIGSTDDHIISFLKAGQPCFETFVSHSDTVVCPVKNFDLIQYTGKFKHRRYLNRGASLSVAAAMMAVKDAHIDNGLLDNAGLFTGAGPNLDMGNEFPEIINHQVNWEAIQALWILKFLPNTAASTIAQLTGIHGECTTVGTACAASLQAIGDAFRKIKDGYLDIALAGGGDSRLSSGAMMAYKKARSIYVGSDHPNQVCRPFDQNRKGFVSGEGAAFFILEDYEHAKKRGAEIKAEILGFGASMDGYRMTDPHPDGLYAQRAVVQAINDAKIHPDDIDLISSHGTGTQLNDKMEAELIHRLFNRRHQPFVIALKSWIGHLSAACGAVELSVCMACIKHDYIPEIRNLNDPCHMSVNFVVSPKSCRFNTVLLENFGFGGQNCAIIFRG